MRSRSYAATYHQARSFKWVVGVIFILAALYALFINHVSLLEAATLFGLWLVQFVFSAINPEVAFWGPLGQHVHGWVTIAYFAWAALELIRLLLGHRKPLAFIEFAKMWRQHVRS